MGLTTLGISFKCTHTYLSFCGWFILLRTLAFWAEQFLVVCNYPLHDVWLLVRPWDTRTLEHLWKHILCQSELRDASASLARASNKTSKPSEVDSFESKYVFEM